MVRINTNAWFTSTSVAGAFFSSATTETIIEKVEIAKTNPQSIKIKKASQFSPNPMIYFAVEGEAANYLLHINPILLDSFDEQEVLIEPNLNLLQYLKLLFSGYDWMVEGKIKLKYLNEFIDLEKEIEFTREYLLNSFKTEIASEQGKSELSLPEQKNGIDYSEQEITEERNAQLLDLLSYIACQREWEEAEWLYEINLDESAELVIQRLKLTEGQSSLLDIIAPKLKEEIASLLSLLKDKITIIAEQAVKIEKLIKINLSLEEENLLLKQEIEQLSQSINALNQERFYLEQEIGSLRQTAARPIGDSVSGEPEEQVPEKLGEGEVDDDCPEEQEENYENVPGGEESDHNSGNNNPHNVEQGQNKQPSENSEVQSVEEE